MLAGRIMLGKRKSKMKLAILYIAIAFNCSASACFNENYSKAMELLKCQVDPIATSGSLKENTLNDAIDNIKSCLEIKE